jgi:hypothetical protein
MLSSNKAVIGASTVERLAIARLEFRGGSIGLIAKTLSLTGKARFTRTCGFVDSAVARLPGELMRQASEMPLRGFVKRAGCQGEQPRGRDSWRNERPEQPD